MNKITRFQWENSVLVQRTPKTQNTKKGSRPKTPKHTPRICFCCPFCLLMVTYRLRIPYSLQTCHSSCLFLRSMFYFFFLFFCFGGCVSLLFPSLLLLCLLFLILLFIFPAFSLCVTKEPDQITEHLKRSFSCSALVPASSHSHLAQLRIPTRPREPPLKMVFVSSLWFLAMC